MCGAEDLSTTSRGNSPFSSSAFLYTITPLSFDTFSICMTVMLSARPHTAPSVSGRWTSMNAGAAVKPSIKITMAPCRSIADLND